MWNPPFAIPISGQQMDGQSSTIKNDMIWNMGVQMEESEMKILS